MKSAAKTKNAPSLLPLPPAVIEHHSTTFLPLVEHWQTRGHVPPVLLLTGMGGVGKREMGYHLAQWLLCERAGFQSSEQEKAVDLFGETSILSPTVGPCGECSSCHKAIQGSWVDFQELGGPSSLDSSTHDDEDSSSESSTSSGSGFAKLKLDSFRDLKASMGFGAHEGRYRIFLIAQAERMTPQAANSLLKLLEEPPPSWVFILTANDTSLLLPTLVSRCQRVRLRPFGEDALKKLLEKSQVPEERQDLCLQLGQGSWKRTLELADDTTWERRSQVLRFLENPPEHLNTLLEWASTNSESLGALLDFMEPLSVELLSNSLQNRQPTDKFLTSHWKYVTMRLRTTAEQTQFWLERAERLALARKEIHLPLNKKLLAQEILLPYLLA